jgi:hypothetical protein
MNEKGLDSAIDSTAIENLKSDGGGRVIFGKYVPTKEEVLQHAQVDKQDCIAEMF